MRFMSRDIVRNAPSSRASIATGARTSVVSTHVDDRQPMTGHAAWVIAIAQRVADISAKILESRATGR